MKRRWMAPVIITVLTVLYYALYFGLIMAAIEGAVMKIAFGVIPVAMAGVMIYVCVQRIKEIRSGEEDDLGQY